MKKIWKILGIIAVLIASLSVTGYASFITDSGNSFAVKENFKIKWKDVSKFGTIEPDKVAFELNADVKAAKPITYTVYVDIDDSENRALGTITATSGREAVKTFNISNITNGKHKVVITVVVGVRTVLEQEENIVVMKGYEKQFMDEFSGYGANWSTAITPDITDEVYDIFRFGGLNAVRRDYYWWKTEKSKGVYDYSIYDDISDKLVKDNVNTLVLSGFGNEGVYPMWQSQIGKPLKLTEVRHAPHTQEGIMGHANFITDLLKQRKEVTYLEVWNEPNIGFWQSDVEDVENYRYYEYADLLKASTSTVRRELKNKTIGGLVYSFGGNYDTVKTFFPLNVYPYMNDFSYHFYSTGTGIDDARSYEARLDKVENYMLDLGGWKELFLTEVGWPTNIGTAGTTEEFSAENMVKMYVIGDQKDQKVWIYSFFNIGKDKTVLHDMFGMINNDRTFKKSFIGITEHNRQLNGGIYVGELDLGDSEIRAFVYLKQGKPVVIIWDGSKERDTLDYTFEGESFKVNDFNGTLVSANTDSITLTEWPAYINGLSHKYIAMAAKQDVKYDRDLFAKTYAEMLPKDILTKADGTFANAENTLDNADEDNVRAAVDEFSQLGLEIINRFKKGELTDLVAARATYELSKTAETLCTVYMSEYDGKALNAPTYTTAAAEAKADKLYRDDNRIMQYSDAILCYAVNTAAKAEKLCGLDYDPEDTKGYIAGWGLLTKLYCDWFDSFSNGEKILNYAILAQVLPDSRKAYVNDNHTVKINANNLSKIPFKGNLRLYDEDNNELAVSENFELGAGGYKYVELSFVVNRYKFESKRNLRLCYVDEIGSRITDDLLVIDVKDKVSMFVQPCTTTVDKMESVDLKFTNLTDEDLTFNLNVESDENYSFVSNTYKITLSANEEKVVKLPISEIKNTKFHYYTIKYEAIDDKGTVMLRGTTPLNFTAIVKADKPIKTQEFTGDISDWCDAYPIYMNTPENPNDSARWMSSDLSARAFLKWDENNLYVLVDVYDDAYYNAFSGRNLWDGDSVQISLDSKNTKSTSYDDDDYELGLAFTSNGPELYAWYSPIKNTVGNVDFINVIRDGNKKVTRYIAAFPKTEIPTMNLSEGASFGMNIGVNDGDILAREDFCEFTGGTISSKDPSKYADFVFVIGNKDSYTDGKAEKLFPTVIEHSINDKD